MSKVKLSILCITYNHAKFIRQALDGFVMQKTNFPFEVIIHDDASTDGTAEIIKENAEQYPDIIKPIFQTKNQWVQGKLPLVHFMLDKVQGEYVAMCEGDDYWTDVYKLQKQVDFLDENPDFSVCFHPVNVVWQDKSKPDSIFPTHEYIFNKDVLSLQDLLKQNFIQTNSVVYRWNMTRDDWPKQNFLPADYLFHLIHAKHGKIKYMDEVMAVYRKHSGGVWDGCGVTDEWFLRCGVLHIKFYEILKDMFDADTKKQIQWLALRTFGVLKKHKRHQELNDLKKQYPDIYQEFINQENKNHTKKIRKYTIGACCVAMAIVIFLLIKRG